MRPVHAAALVFLVSGPFLGCKGGKLAVDGHPENGTPNSTPNNASTNNFEVANNDVEVNPDVLGVPTVTIRRLSQDEFDNTLETLLGDATRPASLRLPEDNVDPFDNNGANQLVSQALIESLETVATEAAERAMSDVAGRDAIIGCTPAGPDDAECFRAFVERFGLKAFRRPVTDEEIESFMPLQDFAVESGDFYEGAKLVIQAMLQMPDFVYHLQRGIAVEGRENTYRLGSYQVASRLSYFLWGDMPDDELLRAAGEGELRDSEDVRAQAERMLQDPRAERRIRRFHAMWLGYHRFAVNGTIGQAMLAESDELIDRVVFDEDRSYFDLFTIGESFLNDELAAHYGLPTPGSDSGTWVDYTDSGRGGILSHATFLSVASKFGDTSPTQRGRLIRERILCQTIDPPPPDLGVDVDMPPTSPDSNCKTDRYATILEAPGCASCHSQMDPVGFGLEAFDQAGQYRTTDVGEPECPIDGEGELIGIGSFNGPRELGEMLVETDQFRSCVVKQVWQFAVGGVAGESDGETIRELQGEFEADGFRFRELLLDIASSESFLYRVEPTEES